MFLIFGLLYNPDLSENFGRLFSSFFDWNNDFCNMLIFVAYINRRNDIFGSVKLFL